MRKRTLKEDIEEIGIFFPKLEYVHVGNSRFLRGDLDICDIDGNYWDTFQITIVIPTGYPYGVPEVIENSSKIPRIQDRHMNSRGGCCVDITHNLLFSAKKGIYLREFIKQFVYPFFANQLYFEINKEYANGEYAHEFAGVQEFYAKKLNITSSEMAIRILEVLLQKNSVYRNDGCICGSGKKMKNCHETGISFLQTIDKSQLESDLKNFKEVQSLKQ